MSDIIIIKDLIPDNCDRNIFITQLRKHCKADLKEVTYPQEINGKTCFRLLVITNKNDLLENCKKYIEIISKKDDKVKHSNKTIKYCKWIIAKYGDSAK